ncbi:MAG TPA: hypothetical protein VM581_03710 [Magnetospirillaceae bacterium]|nr:hypothetical protein [Magnetospirillaceae bacterium]
MKIYFTCSTAEYGTYRTDYHAIRNYLVSQGHILTRDWLDEVDKRIAADVTDLQDIRQIYQACATAIKDADLVIIEDTVSNFSTGHQITLALRAGKPTLVLWQHKNRQFNQMFIHGIESDILQVSEYTPQNLEEIIKVFITKFERVNEENRFHLVIDGVERKYLDWAHFNTGKSRTKTIRAALRQAIESDEDYRNYLLS